MFLVIKAGKGAGSRGGKVIGHTRSGKPVYAPSSEFARAAERMFNKKSKRDTITYLSNEHMAKHPGFTPQDHRDAAELHMEVTHSNAAHRHLSREHKHYADLKEDLGINKSISPCKKCGNTTRDQRCGICGACAFPDGVRKAETFPFLVYEDQRRDVCKFVREQGDLVAQNVAMKPKGDGYVGVFFDKQENPYLFAMSASHGVKFKKAPDDWSAHVLHQDLLDREARVSLKLSQRETYEALSEFADKLSKAFPRKQPETKVKQAKPMSNAGTKVAGKTGKTRYNYSAQGKEKGQATAKPRTPTGTRTAPGSPPGGAAPAAPPPEPFVDPSKLARTLQTTTEVLKKLAMRFVENRKLGGRDGFVKFFEKKFPKLVKKHRISSQYLRMLFNALTQPTQEKMP